MRNITVAVLSDSWERAGAMYGREGGFWPRRPTGEYGQNKVVCYRPNESTDEIDEDVPTTKFSHLEVVGVGVC